MIFQTAHQWLAEADFDRLGEETYAMLVERVGYDKADEVRGALKRVSENTLDALGSMMMSEDTMLKLLHVVSAIVIDTYLPMERKAP